MMTPFETFFAGKFHDMMTTVYGEPGLFTTDVPISQASWDRKAAYLLWQALGKPVDAPAAPPVVDEFEDILG